MKMDQSKRSIRPMVKFVLKLAWKRLGYAKMADVPLTPKPHLEESPYLD